MRENKTKPTGLTKVRDTVGINAAKRKHFPDTEQGILHGINKKITGKAKQQPRYDD